MAKMNIKKIIKANPSVDADQVGETLVIVERLRAGGFVTAPFNLIHPFSKRISKTEDNRPVCHLRRRSK